MALNNFIPEIWSARLLAALDKALVYGSPMVINRDYEGEIRAGGDTVRINSVGDVTISDYTKDTDISAPEALSDAQQTLLIDQMKYFNFAVDDVDRAQQKPQVMDEAMRRAAYGLADKSDQYIASLYAGVASANTLGSDASAVVPTANTAGTTVYDYLVDLGVLLTVANVPTSGRWAILPPWMYGLMLKDSRFVAYGTPENRQALATGEISGAAALPNGRRGQAAGFEIFESNNVPNTNGALYKVIAGHPIAWSYAQQILKTEAYRPEKRFSDAVKGLNVYGAKLVRPDAIAVGTFSKS